jgi:HAD superfamily hydrolase (TIGR01509 family)
MALPDIGYREIITASRGVHIMIKAVVFDFDGLILDTETPEFESFKAMYRDHGAELTIDLWGQCIGTDGTAFEPYQHLEQCLGKAYDREAARLRRKEHYKKLMDEVQPRPGVLDYLRSAEHLGLKIGLASSSSREWVKGYLEQYGLIDYFECIRTREDVPKVKPDPALYREALSCLGVQPSEAVAFEDSPNGSLAAKRAGMYCVIIPNDVTTLLSFGEHDLHLPSMSHMPLTELIQRITSEESFNHKLG